MWKKKDTKIMLRTQDINDINLRECPECGFPTIYGMPGGRDATCKNCGYKDPCCYD